MAFEDDLRETIQRALTLTEKEQEELERRDFDSQWESRHPSILDLLNRAAAVIPSELGKSEASSNSGSVVLDATIKGAIHLRYKMKFSPDRVKRDVIYSSSVSDD